MHALVTGATGFVGPYLLQVLLDSHYQVTVLTRRKVPFPKGVRGLPADLSCLRPKDLRGLKPDVVFHLAGISNVTVAEQDPYNTFRMNALGTANLFRALESRRLHCRMVLIGSGAVYASSHRPIAENAPLFPRNSYSASKLCAESIGLRKAASGWDVVFLRPFNHTGPGQTTRFAAPNFANQIVKAELGLSPPRIHVGDTTPIRDFTDVRDMVRAYVLAAERCQSKQIYNVSSHQRVQIRQLLTLLLSMSKKNISVVHVRNRTRGDAQSIRVGNSKKFRKATGWSPQIPLRQTLHDLLQTHRQRLHGRIELA